MYSMYVRYIHMQYNIGISCYSSTTCAEAPLIVTAHEECCLQSPFQPRTFQEPTMSSTNSAIGQRCAQCIGKEEYL